MMIFYWLGRALRFVLWLVMPPTAPAVQPLQAEEPCPVCGNAKGNSMHCTAAEIGGGTRTARPTILLQRTCANCGARWHQQPIAVNHMDAVWPAADGVQLTSGVKKIVPTQAVESRVVLNMPQQRGGA